MRKKQHDIGKYKWVLLDRAQFESWSPLTYCGTIDCNFCLGFLILKETTNIHSGIVRFKLFVKLGETDKSVKIFKILPTTLKKKFLGTI